MATESNVDRLAKAGLIDPDCLPTEHKEFINNHLSDEEVSHLIMGGQQLAKYSKQGNLRSLPSISV